MFAGGKTKMVPRYRRAGIIPEHFSRYVEPFVGGAAVFADIVNNGGVGDVVLNDVNEPLIDIYRQVRDNADSFVADVGDYARTILSIPVDDNAGRKRAYYALRSLYWENPNTALLYTLMKFGFNGVWQTCSGSHGLYGTPAGLLNQSRLSQVVDADLIHSFSDALSTATITSTDFADAVGDIDLDGAFVFMDPPYRGSVTSYGTDFGDNDQRRVMETARAWRDRGATVVVANRIIDDDNFFREWEEEADFHVFDVTYTAGRRRRQEDGVTFTAVRAREFAAVFTPITTE